MLFTGWNHTPFPLRHFVNDSNRGLPVAVVVHTRQRRMYRDLPKTFGHNIFLTLYFFSCGEMTIKTSKRNTLTTSTIMQYTALLRYYHMCRVISSSNMQFQGAMCNVNR